MIDAKKYYNYILIVAIIAIHSNDLLAQQHKNPQLDSLLFLANQYKETRLDSFQFLLDKVSSIANQQKDSSFQNTALLNHIEALIIFNKYSRADSILQLLQSEQNDEAYYNIRFLLAKGRILSHQTLRKEALDIFYEALEVAHNQEFFYIIPDIYLEIATIIRENNDIENTFKYFQLGLELAKKQNNLKAQVKALILLSKSYNGWLVVNLDSSVFYGRKALQLSEESNYKRGIIEAKK